MSEATQDRSAEDALHGLPQEMFIDDVNTIKAMADPMRVAILKTLYREHPTTGKVPPRTAKEVCTLLGESRTTRIYHHLKLLLAAGLIRKVKSKRRGNLVEDYFGPSALLIRLSPELLNNAKIGDDPVWTDSITALLDATRRDIVSLDRSTPLEHLRFSHREFYLSPEQANACRLDMEALLARYEALGTTEGTPVRVLAVVYPGADGTLGD